MDVLNEARQEIESIDKQMAELFEKRMGCSARIAKYKSENGMPILDEGREKALIEKNEVYVEKEELRPFYRQYLHGVLDISKQYQHTLVETMRVAYSGIEGAFANIAAKKLFPDGELVPFKSFKRAYNAVALGNCDVAVMPIENSAAGEVGQVLDLMFAGDLYVNGLYPLRISQNLLGVKGSSLSDIKKVISHPQALAQCSDYIAEHGFEIIESANTSIAAKQVADMNDISVAAIASKDTAGLYGLSLLDHDINEDVQNTTMFAVVSRNREEVINNSAGATVILMFSVKNEAGTLADAIGVIGKHGFSMNALRSRPLKSSPWQYYFYAEIDGRHAFDRIDSMLDEMSKYCETLKVLGASKENAEL